MFQVGPNLRITFGKMSLQDIVEPAVITFMCMGNSGSQGCHRQVQMGAPAPSGICISKPFPTQQSNKKNSVRLLNY